MKILTVTTQTTKPDDFSWGIEGELAIPGPVVCDSHACGCDRSHAGLNSHKGSTILMVRDIDLDFSDLVTACAAFLEEAGWATGLDDVTEVASTIIAGGAEVAAHYPAGTILRPTFDHDSGAWRYSEANQ